MKNEIYNTLLKKYGKNLLISIETSKIINIRKSNYNSDYCEISLEDGYSYYGEISNINIENNYLYILEKTIDNKLCCMMFSQQVDDKIITDFYL